MTWASREGLPYPLGVSWCADDRAYNFALYSKHATEVRLLMFATPDTLTPLVDVALDPFANKSGRVWHCRVDETRVARCRFYAYGERGVRHLARVTKRYRARSRLVRSWCCDETERERAGDRKICEVS